MKKILGKNHFSKQRQHKKLSPLRDPFDSTLVKISTIGNFYIAMSTTLTFLFCNFVISVEHSDGQCQTVLASSTSQGKSSTVLFGPYQDHYIKTGFSLYLSELIFV